MRAFLTHSPLSDLRKQLFSEDFRLSSVLNIANELESAAGAFHTYLRVLFDNKQDILGNQLS